MNRITLREKAVPGGKPNFKLFCLDTDYSDILGPDYENLYDLYRKEHGIPKNGTPAKEKFDKVINEYLRLYIDVLNPEDIDIEKACNGELTDEAAIQLKQDIKGLKTAVSDTLNQAAKIIDNEKAHPNETSSINNTASNNSSTKSVHSNISDSNYQFAIYHSIISTVLGLQYIIDPTLSGNVKASSHLSTSILASEEIKNVMNDIAVIFDPICEASRCLEESCHDLNLLEYIPDMDKDYVVDDGWIDYFESLKPFHNYLRDLKK